MTLPPRGRILSIAAMAFAGLPALAQDPAPVVPRTSAPGTPPAPGQRPQAGPAQPLPATLTLSDALRLARVRNGNLRAALYDVEAARGRQFQAESAFYPVVTPQFQYFRSQRETPNPQFGAIRVDFEQPSSTLSASYRVLDTGQRAFSFLSARRSLAQVQNNARQTIRQTLFTVHQQFFDTLRAQELQRVADAQVQRAQTILEQTRARVELRDAARRDILQATADVLNAQVGALTARNRTANTSASLRASIGLGTAESLPPLTSSDTPTQFPVPDTLLPLVSEGLKQRPDLEARRRQLEALGYNLRRAEVEAGLTISADISYDFQYTPQRLQNNVFSLTTSFPLFDGRFRREQVREQRATLDAARSLYAQAQLTARAEIEAAFVEVRQNSERVRSATLAVQAARLNYEAAVDSQRAGASDLIEVLTAQVSLVTAEANYIEAVYDYAISEVRLRLVTGRPIAGE